MSRKIHHKYSVWAFISFASALYVIGTILGNFARAETMDREYQAVQYAGKVLKEKVVGCGDYRVLGIIKGYTVNETVVKYGTDSVVVVTGYSFRVKCSNYIPNAPVSQDPVVTNKQVRFTWNDPTTKVNGQPLLDSNILMFRLYKIVNGSAVFVTDMPNQVGALGSYILSDVVIGTYSFGITTVDTDGLTSLMSGMTPVTVQ